MCIIEWDGIAQVEVLDKDTAKIRHKLADAAKSYNWSKVLALIANSTDLVNITRPSGLSLYAPLHQAAHGGASVEVVQRLVGLGAWRTLQNSRGVVSESWSRMSEGSGQRHEITSAGSRLVEEGFV